MHVRRKSTRSEGPLDTARDTVKDLGSKAGEAALQLNELAQTTVVPVVEQAAKTASERIRTDVQPAVTAAAASIASAAAAATDAARDEARVRGKKALLDADVRTRQARKRARQQALIAAERARAVVGLERPKPKRHRLRNLLVTLGLAGAAAWVANKAMGGSPPEPVRIPTTPTPHTPPPPATESATAHATGDDVPTLSDESTSAEAAQSAGGHAASEETVASDPLVASPDDPSIHTPDTAADGSPDRH